MRSGPLLTALAAAAVYAVVLVTTGSVEHSPARVAAASGSIMMATVDLPIAVPSIGEQPAAPEQPSDATPIATPTPTPEPAPPPPGVAAPTHAPEPSVTPPDPPVAAPEAPASSETAGAAAPSADGAEVQRAASPEPVVEESIPDEPTRRARSRPNTEARAGDIQRAAPNADERSRHATSDGSDAGAVPALDGAPGAWLDSPFATTPIPISDSVIDEFEIPPFLLPIYQAAGMQYGIRWEILAAINEIETDYGRNLSVSSAGALGWMQFMPLTWTTYGVDANDDGRADPSNPVDAIFAAARYLRASGGETDISRAVFAYNHADWYVDAVLERAQVLASLPSGLVD